MNLNRTERDRYFKLIIYSLLLKNKTYMHSMRKWYYMKFETLKKIKMRKCENAQKIEWLSYIQKKWITERLIPFPV